VGKSNLTEEQLFSRLFNNKTQTNYWEYISELRSRATTTIFNRSISWANSSNIKQQTIGIDILAQLGKTPRPFLDESLTVFFDLLKKVEDPTVLSSILYAIGHNNEKLTSNQIEQLIEFKTHPNSIVKKGLVWSLLGITDSRAIATLISFMSDKQASIRNWATFGIGSLIERNTKAIREALFIRTKDKHNETRGEAIVGLAIRKDPRVIAIIKNELTKASFGTLIFEAILAFKNTDYLLQLELLYEQNKHDNAVNQFWLTQLETCIEQLRLTTSFD